MPCQITVHNGEIGEKERSAYLARAIEKYGREPSSMDITLDGDFVDIRYDLEPVPFQRIRRITGYLVGTLDRFNNAKRAEEHDRVKHTV